MLDIIPKMAQGYTTRPRLTYIVIGHIVTEDRNEMSRID